VPEPPSRRRNIHPLRDALLAAICTFVISAVGLAIVYLKAHEVQVDSVRTELLQLARATAAQIDGDLHRKLISPDQEGSPEHLALLEPLARMHRATRDIYYVYTGVYRSGRIYWVLDGAKLYRVPGNDLAAAPLMTLYEERDALYEAAFRDGVEYIDPAPRPSVDGHSYLSAAAPIRDRAGNVVGMFGLDMVTTKLDARVAAIRRVLIIALAVVSLLSIGAGAIALRMRRFAAAIVRKMRHARAEAEHNAARAEAASRAKAAFLAMMSHEIRTPMNGMLGVADLLRNQSPDPAQKKLLDILSTSGESLLRILNDILDFSKIEADRLELRPRPFELRELLDELDALLTAQARGKPVRFIVETDDDLPRAVEGDRQRLSQILLNLGGNAIKFTDRGEVRLQVHQLARDAGRVRLGFTIRDTGIGMSTEALSRLFVPFVQVADSGHQRGGTGLGLVIAQKLVRLMGGDITVQSAPGEGSTFAFDLELPGAELTTHARTGALPHLVGLSVLVAEDNAVNQTIIQAMLKQLGHGVSVVANGREALDALAHDAFDLVLMDCNMPEMDGLEATRLLRAGARGVRDVRVPVIALTANAMDGDREQCLAAGMNDFLAKPVNIATLRQAIDRVRGAQTPRGLRAAV
jgi:signal transduction histidine kinase/ActR/RegA family two-component response regulator